jgi:hypothetical protein
MQHQHYAQHKRPLWIGALLASVAPALCLLAALIPAQVSNPPAIILADAALVFAISVPIALVATLLLGLPYVLWLRSHGLLTALAICLGAIVIGAIAFFLFAWALSWDHQVPELSAVLYGAGFGLISGIAFCVGMGPNNSFKPKPLRGSA